MARNPNITKKKKESGVESGDLYVAPTGATFRMPKIDADLIQKYSENKYIFEGLNKQQRVLFKKRITVQVYDTEEQQEEPKGTAILEKMIKNPEVGLWYTLQRMHRNVMEWGPAPYNAVWETVGGIYTMTKLRDLLPITFSRPGGTYATVKNRILPGICINDETGEIEYWQTKRTGSIEKLENIQMMVDPICSELGGTPFILPLIPIISMIKYSWKRQMQILNKIGIFFIKVTEPQGNDKEYAQKIMRNVSSEAVFQLRGNMDVVNLGIGSDGSALPTITELGMQVRQFFSPSEIISKEGTLIGGSANPEFDLYMAYIEGQHRWLEEECEFFLQPFLTENAYDDRFIIRAEIPDPTPDRSEALRSLAETGHKIQAIYTNEKRAILEMAAAGSGLEFGSLNEKQQKALEAEYARAPSSGSQMQKAAVAASMIPKDELDSFAVVSKSEGKKLAKYVQATLGIESGEM